MQFDLAMTDELLATTRAVRKRLDFDRPVPRNVIEECLELALQAPSGSNRQTWRWVVVEDADIKRQLGEIYQKAAHFYFEQQGAARRSVTDPQVARLYASSSWLADNMGGAPMLVIPCIQDRPGPDWPAARVTSHYGSIFPAVWNFQLALRSRGLGSTLTTLHLMDEKRAAEILGIPDDVMQVAMLPVAYTKGTDFKRAAREPLGSLLHWNHW